MISFILAIIAVLLATFSFFFPEKPAMVRVAVICAAIAIAILTYPGGGTR